MESFTIRKKNGELAGPYGLRVIRAFVVSGRFTEQDFLVTPSGDIPLATHPALRDLWHPNKDQESTETPPPSRSISEERPPPTGRIVFYQGKLLPPGSNPQYAGKLSKHPLLFLMYRFMLAGLTGRLHLRSGRETVDIFLEYGEPTYAVSSHLETRLGELLVQKGLLNRQQQAHTLERTERECRPLGQILLDEQLLTPSQIQEALTSQFKIRFFKALEWRENAVYRFYKDHISGGRFPIQIERWHLLKEGALTWMALPLIEDYLLPYRNNLVIRQIHPKLKLEQFGLDPNERAFIEGITQQDPLNDVVGDAVERGLLTEEHAHRLIYLMMQVQFLRFGEEKIGARTQRQLKELELYINRLKTQTRLQRLGLKGGASPGEIRSKYLELAKRYHPDHLPPGTHPLVAKSMSEAFALIAEAYRVLSG